MFALFSKLISRIKPGGNPVSHRMPSVSRDDLIIFGIGILAVLICGTLVWAGFIFFDAREKMDREIPPGRTVSSITAKEFDGIIQILDERDARFGELIQK